MPPLGEAFRTSTLQALMNSHFDGPLSFVVGMDSVEGRYGVHMHLSGITWRLSGLDVPEEVSARLARAIGDKVGGFTEPGVILIQPVEGMGNRNGREAALAPQHQQP